MSAIPKHAANAPAWPQTGGERNAKLDFAVLRGDEASHAQWSEAAQLFSSEYGRYIAEVYRQMPQEDQPWARGTSLSVSNFGYLDVAKSVEIDLDDPNVTAQKLFSLMPSKTMWRNGEYFNPNFLLVDRKRHLVCHKEQFPASAHSLPGEYVIQDRRFTFSEIAAWAEEAGLTIEHHRFVRAGFKASMQENQGKEILLVTRKGGAEHA